MAAVALINSTLFSDANLKAYWRYESDSTDEIGTADGTDSNMTYVAGKFGNAASFNNTSGKITIADNAAMSIATNGTWMFWIKPNSVTANGGDQLFAQWASGQYSVNILQLSASGNLGIYLASNHTTGAGSEAYSSGTAITTDWCLVAIVKNGATVTFYINGSAAGATGTQVTIDTGATSDFIFGNNGNGDGYYGGLLDDFAIFDRALSATEIADHYSGADAVGGGTVKRVMNLPLLGVG